jgi:glycosyltransferase involved in cell wall biosynthesis
VNGLRILFLTQIIPYPPDAGPKVKTWHVLRYLAGRGHSVTLASFVRPEEEPYVAALEQVCERVHTVPIRRSRLADIGYWLRSHLTGRPFLVERDDLGGMRALVRDLLETGPFDAIHCDQLTMTQFALPYARTPGSGASPGFETQPVLVFDAHNAVWTIIERMRENAPWFLRPVAALEAARVRRYEGLIVRRFDDTLAVTEPDRQALLRAAEPAAVSGVRPALPEIQVVPIAVDAVQLQPVRRQAGSSNIVTLGTLHYPPNADGIRWFAQEVFPLVRKQAPAATLTIIGKNPPADFLQLASQHPGAITVTGYVPDLVPYLEQAAVMVVAVRAGGGMRVRILEAFARAMPVVTTTVGLEGIQAEPGRDVLVADSPEGFAQAVLRVLADPELQSRLAASGRRLAERRYDWQVVLSLMDEVYGQAVSQPVGMVGAHA